MDPDNEVTRDRGWLPFFGIVAASAVAHLWCLGSQFYMDDNPQIRENAIVHSGRFWEAGLNAWTTLGYVVQHRLFGMWAAGFHAVNWLLHTAVACVLFALGRDFLGERGRAGVAWFGALLFAVHPLASEIPNYVRTQDLAWVTLFSLLACWACLRFLTEGGWWKAVACVLCILGATFSKGPGLFHALMMTGGVGLAALSPRQWQGMRRLALPGAGVLAALIGGLWMAGLLDGWLASTASWREPRFLGHAFTLSRVFWEFAWRSVIPMGLSADHLIAETLIPPGAKFWNIPDKASMGAMAGVLAFAAFSGWLAWNKRTRLFGICVSLYVAAILVRFLYLIPEFMPEYRIYPGLPWFCLGAAILLAAGWKRILGTISPRVPVVILLGLFSMLSAKRAVLWHDLDALMADVLQRYPARLRVLWVLDERDLAAGNPQPVIDRHEKLWPGIEREFVQGNKRLAPAREIPSGDFVLALVAHTGRHARALAVTQSPAAGLRVIAQLEMQMKAMKMDPQNKPLEWSHFYHDKGLVLEIAGNHAAAAECLRQKGVQPRWEKDLKRVEAKLAAEGKR